MRLNRFVSYSLMTAGALVAARSLVERWQWEEANVFAAIMLDWDDVQAVATRAPLLSAGDDELVGVETLLARLKASGATHLSLPELTLNRLLRTGALSVDQGSVEARSYLRAKDVALAEFVSTELQARLPHLQVRTSSAKNPLISFLGDLPTIAEIGLGFDPAQADLARRVGLEPVPRPIGYSWVQPEMIDRTLDQAAALGAKVIAFEGNLIPGHEFKIQTTVEAMQRNGLTYAYFSERRHQKGDWFLAKNLAPAGWVVLAHEFAPDEMLEDDWHTLAQRWATLAVEAGIRFCAVRFFRVLHAADPLECLAYVEVLARALGQAGLTIGSTGVASQQLTQLQRDPIALAGAGASAAGAVGLVADLLPLPEPLKLLGVGAAALVLAGLPFWERPSSGAAHSHNHNHDHDHHHDHDHNHDHHDHHDHDHDHGHHDHDHDHHHDHDHEHGHSHAHDRSGSTAYAPKGIALATAVAFPAAMAAIDGASPFGALAQALTISATGMTALNATTAEGDYLLAIEEFRGFNLDWLLPLTLTATLLPGQKMGGIWRWLPLLGLGLVAQKQIGADLARDFPAAIDREHPHTHTHHLSAFQRALGDGKMALSLKPLRKWSLLAPLGALAAVMLKSQSQEQAAVLALTTAVAGQVATLTGVRNGRRPLAKTLEGRARGWLFGAALAGILWLVSLLFRGER